MKVKYIVVFYILLFEFSYSQSLKKLINTAEKNYEKGNYTENEEFLRNALIKHNNSYELIKLQILNYDKLDKPSISDSIFNEYSTLLKSNNEFNFCIERFYKQKKYSNIINELKLVKNLKTINLFSWDFYFNSLIFSGQLDTLENNTDKMINLYPDYYIGWYYKGYICELKNELSKAAILYNKSLYYLNNNPEAVTLGNISIYSGLTRVAFKLSSLKDASFYADKVLKLDENNSEINFLKGKICILHKDYNLAQSYLYNAYSSDKKNVELVENLFYNSLRTKNSLAALSYITQLGKMKKLSDTLIYNRGFAFLENQKYLEAYNDFKTLKNNKFSSSLLDSLISASKIDHDKPNVFFTTPLADTIYHGIQSKTLNISIKTSDISGIKQIKINDLVHEFYGDTLLVFEKEIILNKYADINVEVIDQFDNSSKMKSVIVADNIKPQIEILFPYVSNQGSIIPNSSADLFLYLELKLSDDFGVKKLNINSIEKNYDNKKEIKFLDKVKIQDTDSIKISCEDYLGNVNYISIFIDREKAKLNEKNPMGKTFVLVISNSNYENFNQLEGTKNDVKNLKNALSNYLIDSIIHYENVKLNDFKNIINNDIKYWVNKLNIQSLLIWYSGHGTYSEFYNSGYWIPTNGMVDDFDSFYSLSEMKIILSGYKKLNHLLLVSDACQTGPSFYNKKIIKNDIDPCSDWTLSKMRSMEVFTSSDTQLSSDVSLFAKTFSKILLYNPLKCVGISEIANKVTEVVSLNQKQIPVFGNITGMESENGSFMFIKRSYIEDK
jgi:hypothetical protein